MASGVTAYSKLEFEARMLGISQKEIEEAIGWEIQSRSNKYPVPTQKLVSIMCPVCEHLPIYDLPNNLSAKELADTGTFYHERGNWPDLDNRNFLFPSDRFTLKEGEAPSFIPAHKFENHTYLEKIFWFIENFSKYHDAGLLYTKWIKLRECNESQRNEGSQSISKDV